MVLVLASGWRYYGRPRLPVTLAVGALSGFIGGAVQISGPPIIVYWLGSGSAATIVRATFIVYFTIFSAAAVVTYALRGLLPPHSLALAALIGPLQIASMALGGRLFSLASEKTYRRVAYAIVATLSGLGMLWCACRVYRDRTGDAAKKSAWRLFGFSILYLFLLFATLLAERLSAGLLGAPVLA